MKEKNILIVDDSKTVRAAIEKILKEAGYRTTSVEDGKSALETFKKTPFPVVITDLEMPVMNGKELIAHLKKMEFPPIMIVFTKSEEPEIIIDIMSLGVSEYIIKPVKKNDLVMKVHKAFTIRENRAIARNSEKGKVLSHLFYNLQRSFNQGAGLGTQISLLGLIAETATPKDNCYEIDMDMFNLLKKNQKIAESAISSFSEIERLIANEMQFESTPCLDVYNDTKDVIEELKSFKSIGGHQVQLTPGVPELTTSGMMINRNYFKVTIKELLLNAMKFSEPGSSISLDISINASSLVFIVQNSPRKLENGIIGIPPEYEEIIFEPFSSLSKYGHEAYKTMDFGLGLTVVEQVVIKHSGTVSISNIPDSDSTDKIRVQCRIKLPLAE